MSKGRNIAKEALQILRTLPRISLNNVQNLKYSRKKAIIRRGDGRGSTCGLGKNPRISFFPLGNETKKYPFFLKFPVENYYKNRLLKREYPPFSLFQLQRSIDTNRIDISKPIDLATLCNAGVYHCDPKDNHFGVHLTDEGIDQFKAKVNIEVQWASEPVIAAIERNGGVITTAYFDIRSITALVNPKKFFLTGECIPRRLLPPEDAVLFYTSAATRGYLADPEEISRERLVLAQKYGYKLKKIEDDPQYEMLMERKDPRQIFYGLAPGWVVNLSDKTILKATSPELNEFFKS